MGESQSWLDHVQPTLSLSHYTGRERGGERERERERERALFAHVGNRRARRRINGYVVIAFLTIKRRRNKPSPPPSPHQHHHHKPRIRGYIKWQRNFYSPPQQCFYNYTEGDSPLRRPRNSRNRKRHFADWYRRSSSVLCPNDGYFPQIKFVNTEAEVNPPLLQGACLSRGTLHEAEWQPNVAASTVFSVLYIYKPQ